MTIASASRVVQRAPPVLLVAAGAALWATDGWLRIDLVGELPAAVIVFMEHASELGPALLAVGAASLWALGTVLGRRMAPVTTPSQLMTLRFAVGMPAAAIIVSMRGEWGTLSTMTASILGNLIVLALVPGLLAIWIYYRGLLRTPASVATLAELAFPLATVLIGYFAFDRALDGSQWIGLFVLVGAITALGLANPKEKDAYGIKLTRDRAPVDK